MAHFLLSKSLSRRIDQYSVLRKARWSIEAGIVGLFWGICARLSPDAASGLGRRLLRTIGPRLQKSGYMERNLSVAFPDLTDAERRALLRQVWANMGAVLGEYPHLERLAHTAFDAHFEIDDQLGVGPYQVAGKQGIFVSAHFGNWETAAGAAAHLGVPLTVVYTPINNPYIDRKLKTYREGLGCELLDRDTSLPHLIKNLSRGRSLGLVVDHRDDGGVPVPFFGYDKLSTVIPARLALRHGCDLIPARVERLNGAHFRFTLFPPVKPNPELATAKAQAEQMTADLNAIFEQWIRERPQQWLCTKRAWAKQLMAQAALREAATPQTKA